MNAKTRKRSFDAIVIGGGGAGLMCAATAGQRGRNVVVIDHSSEPGKKILISGGGRCNFTNRATPAERYLSANRHFAKSALKRYPPDEFIALVGRHGIAWHEKTLGQLFCDGSASQIVQMLLDECTKGGVEIVLGQPVANVSHADGKFAVEVGGEIFFAPSLVVATGGPSIPKLGASGYAYDLARQFGLKIVEPRPALVPFKLGGDEALFRELSGVATEVVVACGKAEFREAALFTHKGLSGPAMLQISSYWKSGQEISVNFLPNAEQGWLKSAKENAPRSTLTSHLAPYMPQRLAEVLEEKCGGVGPLNGMADKRLALIEQKLSRWQFSPSGTEGFAKAEVTSGGVSTKELSSQTMEAAKVKGLYVIGEAVDVTGWLGGYNFQWAWASGWAAGQAI